jgi:hypothetical protein
MHTRFAFFIALVAWPALGAVGRGFDMDYGPALNYTVQWPSNYVGKGVTVRLMQGTNVASALFDTERGEFVAAWRGWLDLSKTHLTSYKGSLAPRPSGEFFFQRAGERVASVRILGTYRDGSNIAFRVLSNGVHRLLSAEWSGGEEAPRIVDVTRTFRTNGGPTLWPQVLVTKGRRGTPQGAFAIDSLTLPENNRWRSWMRLTAFDFFSDGRAAVTTWNGDVWLVSGIDDSLQNVRWKRFAAGLFDPLGLKILRDELYVLERHQITRLRDLNGDDEADAFDCVNSAAGVSPSYHAFAMDLQADKEGNFYYTRAGQRVDPAFPLNGGMVRVSADGSRAELIAHGLRAANGMSVGPTGEITCCDNQGNWIPSGRLNLVEPGKFYGYVPHAHGMSTQSFAPPLCWIPQSLDNSGGGQVWVTSSNWAPALQGALLHTSYGMGTLFAVLWEKVDGVPQGGVVKFPLAFDSGIQRARFHPRDGQLYVVGLKGWQTKGVKDGAFQRVRYTGQPLRMPTALHVRADGLELTFSEPLDRASAQDPQNYSLEQWNYQWSEKYGSDDYSVADPSRKGRDRVEIPRVQLLAPSRILVEVPSLRPVMQMRLRISAKFADGTPAECEVFPTINRVPAR